MANNSMPIERLQALDNVEKDIAGCIQSAGIQMTVVLSLILMKIVVQLHNQIILDYTDLIKSLSSILFLLYMS